MSGGFYSQHTSAHQRSLSGVHWNDGYYSLSANYEYGPFGEAIRANGLMAAANPFRFSTKHQDNESDLIYYGHRYYSASLGRWLGRDPINELGGANLYGFVGNRPTGSVDPFGQVDIDRYSGGPAKLPTNHAPLVIAATVTPLFTEAYRPLFPGIGQDASGRVVTLPGPLQDPSTVPVLVTSRPTAVNSDPLFMPDPMGSMLLGIIASFFTPGPEDEVALISAASKLRRPCLPARLVTPKPFAPKPIAPAPAAEMGPQYLGGEFGLFDDAGFGFQPAAGGGLEDANFAQIGINKAGVFSPEGVAKYSQLAGRPITTADELAAAIREGIVNASQIEVDYVVVSGQKVILNTRTSTALVRGGVPRVDWVGRNVTGRPVPGMPGVTFDDLALQQTIRSKIPPTGTPIGPK